jgi:UDP-N-acetylmuramate--alanine ligase
VTDSLAAFAAAYENGVGADEIAAALSEFRGVSRRMENCGKSASGADVFSDYAHHPTEIETTLAAAREIAKGRVYCAFQPHTYSRTANFFDDFARVLADSGCEIVLTEIYSARETTTGGVSSAILCDRVKALGKEAAYVPALGDLADYLEAKAKEGDMILLMGAGDIDSCARMLVR